MKSTTILAALVVVVGYIGSANAQQAGSSQGPAGEPGGGSGMGPWMMGPNGMMGYGNMGPWMMGQNGVMPMMGWRGQGASMCTMMTGHIEGRLAYLKTELKITDAQAPLWNAYAGAARDNARAMTAHCTAMISPGGSTALSLPDRLDQHEQFMAAQLEALRAMNKTLKPLYTALSETQKQTANQFLWGPMGMM